MPAPYTKWNYKGRDVVKRAAQNLLEARPRSTPLSPFVFMTDPQRVLDPVAAAHGLPEGAALIYRHFGNAGYVREAEALRQVTFERNQQLLLGHDPELAIAIGADGVHFRRDARLQAPALWRQNCPDWIITMAGLKGVSLKGTQIYSGDLSVLDGLFVSSVFYSKSPSAGDPIGIEALKQVCTAHAVPVFALGGINARTAQELVGSGAAGLAGIEGLMRAGPKI